MIADRSSGWLPIGDPLHEWGSSHGSLLMAGAVGDVDGAVGTDGDALDVVELAATFAAPRTQERTRGAEALDTVVVLVDDVDGAVDIAADAVGKLELAVVAHLSSGPGE